MTPIGKDKWSIAVVRQFVEKVMEKSFVASIVNVKEEVYNNYDLIVHCATSWQST